MSAWVQILVATTLMCLFKCLSVCVTKGDATTVVVVAVVVVVVDSEVKMFVGEKRGKYSTR